MLEEAIQALALHDDGIYLDGTAGAGGHSAAIVDQLGDQGRLIAIDRDPSAVATVKTRFAADERVEVIHSPFSKMAAVVEGLGLVGRINGILLDLGVSSMQLDQPDRGFSFMRSGSLDMRMDTANGVTLADWLAEVDEERLIRVLREYGEERFARKIARAILERHREQPLTTTGELAELVAESIPHHPRDKHPATRTFQALRIAVNDELGELQRMLAQAIGLLAPGGRLVVLSFHSLEDRMVKQFIQKFSQTGLDLPLDLPVVDRVMSAPLKRVRVGKKPGRVEVRSNPRSRSVIMRVAERTETVFDAADKRWSDSGKTSDRQDSNAGQNLAVAGCLA